jgi:hypothetical protein
MANIKLALVEVKAAVLTAQFAEVNVYVAGFHGERMPFEDLLLDRPHMDSAAAWSRRKRTEIFKGTYHRLDRSQHVWLIVKLHPSDINPILPRTCTKPPARSHTYRRDIPIANSNPRSKPAGTKTG